MKELLLLSGLGLITLLLEIFKWRKAIVPVAVAGLALNIALCIIGLNQEENLYNMLFLDRSAMILMILISGLGIFWFLSARPALSVSESIADHSSLVLFSMVGAVLLISYVNMSMLFLGVEILSIPVYVLAGSDKRNIASNEASFKYFLMGAFASAFLLLGIACLYGATATFDVRAIGVAALSGASMSLQLLVLGLLLILFAMAFKVSAVPFHFWAPDVYSGAPTQVTAYMATIVKVAALAAFFRLFGVAFGLFHGIFASVLLIIAVLSVVAGNVIALSQDQVKRMLAYSGIGHAGFVLLAIAVQQNLAAPVVLYYLFAYSVSAMAAFFVLNRLEAGSASVASFNGLVKRNPLLAGTMTLSLLSMAGIPPLSGFFAKYFVLINALLSEHAWAAVIAILASLVGVYYYFRVLIAMFFAAPENEAPITLGLLDRVSLLILCFLIIGMGLYPEFIFTYVK